MNKTITKTLVVGFVYLAFCGTVTAAPGRGNGVRAPQKAPAQQRAPEHNGGRHAPAPANHCEPVHHCAPVAHRAPPPVHHEPPPPPPAPCHGAPCAATGWAVLGAVVGGIVGACL